MPRQWARISRLRSSHPFVGATGRRPRARNARRCSRELLGAYFSFVNAELLPYLRELKNRPNATPRQKVISEIMSGVERVRIDTERNYLDVLDRVRNGL